jgi:competence protein ComEC
MSFLSGVLLFDYFRSDVLFGILLFIPFILLVPKPFIRPLSIWGICLFLGMIRVFVTIEHTDIFDVLLYARDTQDGPRVAITGTIAGFPDTKTTKTQVFVNVHVLQIDAKVFRKISGKILVNLPKYPSVRYGDMITVEGELKIPPVWEDFSYKRFLEKEGVHAYIPWGNFVILESNTASPVFEKLFNVRLATENALRRKIPEPEASFAVGILLGGERGFPENVIEEFRITGLSHLLALSGFNITILILFVFWVFQIFPKYIGILSTFIFVIAFVLLTGASASVIRAAAMGLLSLFVLYCGHEGKPLYILMWSVVLIVLWNPFLLLSDISFQLSVAAVLGLILFTPIWKEIFEKISGVFGFREALQTTLAAQITAVPLIAFYFQRISLVSPVANLLIAPLIPLSMLFSSLSLLPVIGTIFAFIAYMVLHFSLFLTRILSQVPMADISFSVGMTGLFILYVIIGLIWKALTIKKYNIDVIGKH